MYIMERSCNADIKHIIEIIKHVLYFAVLEGEDNKILQNTNGTIYFSVDDELVYFNYYFDFGPLNISCLYKYCCKLNSYLHGTNGLKRIVHYTTSNAMRRVNAAYLMGSFCIIYLKMNPNEVYKILLNSGGPFKPFVDASQGVSQYTINILDCFHAIFKAMNLNFFNFSDFNVLEYDMYAKLQNGDMNWILPRKFLAFIGPTNTILNGHPPDCYIKYFLENDIKTVIRLNNKLYDSVVFTNAGIEHHELFFPDGTIPSKQILLRFLSLSESARACVAVHCKAGLGRTGSLIGAYIMKHYQMSAHEAIAWMRICRPGSVIGQQQGWLEKIESWLWRQGTNFRLQHFGDGDKIPHHKYGIYSKMWPFERDKLIRYVRKKRVEAQRSQLRNSLENDNMKKSVNFDLASRSNCGTVTQKGSLKSRPKLSLAIPINEENRNIFNINQAESNLSKTDFRTNFTHAPQISNRTSKQKGLLTTSKQQDNNKVYQVRLKKLSQSECQNNYVEKVQKEFAQHLEQTQGDKLNEIKSKRLLNFLHKDKNNEPGTSRKRSQPPIYSIRT